MTLIRSKQKPEYRWNAGDLITAAAAASLLGYKSPKQFQDAARLENLAREFEAAGCRLTTGIWIGGGRRFLRSEIDAFLEKRVSAALETERKRKEDLGLL